MAILVRSIQTVGIWLTAIMTLVAGAPHLDCRCPNGNLKPFCLSLVSGKIGCCCEGSCCSAFPADDTKGFAAQEPSSACISKKSCCCCNADQENARGESRTTPRLGKACCQKTLAEAAVVVLESSLKVPVQDLTTHPHILAPEFMVEIDGFGLCDRLSAYHHHWPPSSDLVTVLQRLLI